MMRLGIFARTFERQTFEGTFDAVKLLGLDCLQFNFSCAGLPTVPEVVEPALIRRIRTELEKRSLSMAAISGTCNLIHPDPGQRVSYVKRLQRLIGICGELGTTVVTLCTGTRDAQDMWRGHAENDSAEAWRDLRISLDALVPIAEKYNIILGIEPEPGNVVASAEKARRLLNEMKTRSLRIVFDAANLVQTRGASVQQEILEKAFDLLGAEIVLAHAKDLTGQAPGLSREQLDYALYFSLLHQAGFDGAVILHGFSEAEISGSVSFLRAQLSATSQGFVQKPNAVLHPR